MPDRQLSPVDAPAIGRRPSAAVGNLDLPGRPAANPFDQRTFRGRLDWGLDGLEMLAPVAGLVVVVDVLSFSTAVSVAIEADARVVPYASGDSTAAAYARSIGAVLASANRSASGPTLSPASLQRLRSGESLVLPSPNGAACAIAAAESGAMVVAGCFRNAAAVGRLVAAHGGGTAVIAAGERWPDGRLRPAVEDLLGAGAILAALAPIALSPEARAAVAAFQAARPHLEESVRQCASGLELVDAGFERDVRLAAELDATDRVPVLVDGTFSGGMG